MIKIKGVLKDLSSKISEKEAQNIGTEETKVIDTTSDIEKSSQGDTEIATTSTDEEIVQQLESSVLSFEEMANLISQISNESTRQEQVKKLLDILYSFDTDTSRFSSLQQENTPNDHEIMTVITEAKKINQTNSKEIEDLVRRIVAKQMAVDYKHFGCIVLSSFKVDDGLSAIKMLNYNMQDLVVEEITKLFPDAKVDAKQIKAQLLDDLAGEIALNCNNSQTHSVVVPQSRVLQDLLPEEREAFVSKITAKLEEGIEPEKVKEEINAQIDAPIIDQKYYLDQISSTVQTMDDATSLNTLKLVDTMVSDMAKEPELINPVENVYKAVTIVPKADRDKAVNAFTTIINNRFSTKEQTGPGQEAPGIEPKMI